MDEAEDTSLSKDKQRVVLSNDEADQAAADVAGLTLQEEPDMRLIKAQFDLLRYLLTKAQTSNDRFLIGNPTSETLRTDAEKVRATFELIAQIERDDYMCIPQDQEELQFWMHNLLSLYAGGSDTDERIARVIAIEKSMGLGDASDELWGA